MGMFKRVYGLKNLIIIFSLLLAFIFAVVDISIAAQEAEEEDYIVRTKKVSGEISMIRPTFISIIYAQKRREYKDYEAMFLLDEEVKYTRRAFDELKMGDEIDVVYDEYSKLEINPETGEEEEKFVKRETKEIKFVNPALKKGLISK